MYTIITYEKDINPFQRKYLKPFLPFLLNFIIILYESIYDLCTLNTTIFSLSQKYTKLI